MNPSTLSPQGTLLDSFLWMGGRQIILLVLAVLMSGGLVRAQSGGDTGADRETVQMLLQRVNQLEARVAQLEAAKQTSSPVATPVTPANPTRANPTRANSSMAPSLDEASPQAETINEQQ